MDSILRPSDRDNHPSLDVDVSKIIFRDNRVCV